MYMLYIYIYICYIYIYIYVSSATQGKQRGNQSTEGYLKGARTCYPEEELGGPELGIS